MLAHGTSESKWPVQRWGLSELTLLAFYYHPDLRVARARAEAARADVSVAAQRQPISLAPNLQHHTRTLQEQESVWSLGFEIGIPIAGGSRRAAATQRAEALAEAARLDVGGVTWQLRSRLRARLLELYAARLSIASYQAEIDHLRTMVRLLEQRLEVGYASSTDVTVMRLRLSESEIQSGVARIAQGRAEGELAAALGLPLTTLESIALNFDAFEVLPDPPAAADGQREALHNRLDLQRTLLEYAAADADVAARGGPSVSDRVVATGLSVGPRQTIYGRWRSTSCCCRWALATHRQYVPQKPGAPCRVSSC